jgi:hypothetical protein
LSPPRSPARTHREENVAHHHHAKPQSDARSEVAFKTGVSSKRRQASARSEAVGFVSKSKELERHAGRADHESKHGKRRASSVHPREERVQRVDHFYWDSSEEESGWRDSREALQDVDSFYEFRGTAVRRIPARSGEKASKHGHSSKRSASAGGFELRSLETRKRT